MESSANVNSNTTSTTQSSQTTASKSGLPRSTIILLAVLVPTILIGSGVVAMALMATRTSGESANFFAPPPPPKPTVPVSLSVRKGILTEGYVLKIMNDGERHLLLTVTHERPTLNQRSAFNIRLDPGRSTEVGGLEGHTFYPGDVVSISHDEFSTRQWTINP